MNKLRLSVAAALLIFPLCASAAITFVHKTNDNNSSANNVTPAEPTGVTSGDLILATCVKDIDDGTWTDPADFVEIDQFGIGAPIAGNMYFGYKVRGATAGSGYNFSNSDTPQQIGCTLTAWRGVDSGSPLDVTYSFASHYNDQAGGDELQAAQPITTVTNGSVVVIFFHEQSDTSVTSGPPSGYTERGLDIAAGRQIVVVSKEVAVAGTETPGAWTFSDLATSASTAQVTLALRASGTTPTFTAGPSVGSVTSTTIPVTATSDTTGTWKAVACPDGQTFPTVAQVVAGNCTGDIAAEATFSQAVVATVGDSDTLSGLDPGTTYDVHSAIDATVDSSSISTNANVTTNSLPTFSSGPSAGGTGGTTITVNFTSDQTGDVYGVACPDGQASPTVAQVKAGNCTGDIAAVDAFTQAVVASVADTDTFTGLSNSTTYDTHYMIDSTVNGDSAAIASLANQTTTAGSGPEFTSGPSVAAATNGFTISGTITCTGTCTVEAVACNPGDAAPSNAELEAGQCGGGNAALMNASEAWTTATPDSFLLTSANKPARFNVYVAGTDGTNDTAVIEFLNQNRSADSGQTIAVLSSVSTTSIFDLDSYFDPEVAAGDVIEYDSDTNEDAGCSVSFEADGDLVLTPDTGTECDGKRTIDISYQDVSSATTGLFTAPPVGNFTTDDVICNGNTAPEALEAFEVPFAWNHGEEIAPLDLTNYITDADGDSLTFTLVSGAWPTGISQSGTGDKDVTGTPTVEDESGVALVVRGTDPCGDSADYSFYDGTAVDFYVIITFAAPNLDDLTPAEAEAAVVAAAPWRVADPGVVITGYDCGTGQSFLNIATQEPGSGGGAGAYEPINVELVGAILPDLTGMTLAEAVAAIEAVCP